MAPAVTLALKGLLQARSSEVGSGDLGNGAFGSATGPLGEAKVLFARDSKSTQTADPSRGVLDPHDISNVGFFVLFALIGVAFVVTGIWFFFWAKNGGFHFKQNDWDEYKSTVLRRRGPNGTLLSGATPSTNLGGGSVYKDVIEDDGTTVVTESTGLTGVTAGASDIAAREKRKAKQDERNRERRKRRGDKSRSNRHVGEDGVEDEMAEKDAQQHLRSYRHERPARVGGLNKESEGSQWDGSTNPTDSTVSSELLSNKQRTPTTTPTKKKPAAIRKVYSTANRNEDRETERIRAEARRLREESRTSRRDFSYQRSPAGDNNPGESLLDGGDLGTKSYHHPIPELRGQRDRDREEKEKRPRRGGYRRGRGDDHDL